MTTEKVDPKFGEIYLYAGSRHSGDTKKRPGIVVSKDSVNISSDKVQIVPLTTELSRPQALAAVRFHLPPEISSLEHESVAMCDKTTVILKSRIRSQRLGKLPPNYIDHLKGCLSMSHENAPVLQISLVGA